MMITPNKDVSWKWEEKQVDSSFDAVSRIADPGNDDG